MWLHTVQVLIVIYSELCLHHILSTSAAEIYFCILRLQTPHPFSLLSRNGLLELQSKSDPVSYHSRLIHSRYTTCGHQDVVFRDRNQPTNLNIIRVCQKSRLGVLLVQTIKVQNSATGTVLRQLTQDSGRPKRIFLGQPSWISGHMSGLLVQLDQDMLFMSRLMYLSA